MRRITFMYEGKKMGCIVDCTSFEYILENDGIDINKVEILEDVRLDGFEQYLQLQQWTHDKKFNEKSFVEKYNHIRRIENLFDSGFKIR